MTRQPQGTAGSLIIPTSLGLLNSWRTAPQVSIPPRAETRSCLTSAAKASCFSPAQNARGALVWCGTRRFDGIFPNGSCRGSAVICQPHFCFYPIPLDTSAFKICFEYIRSYDFFPSSFNYTFCLLANTLPEFISTSMFLHEPEPWLDPTKPRFHLPCDL